MWWQTLVMGINLQNSPFFKFSAPSNAVSKIYKGFSYISIVTLFSCNWVRITIIIYISTYYIFVPIRGGGDKLSI